MKDIDKLLMGASLAATKLYPNKKNYNSISLTNGRGLEKLRRDFLDAYPKMEEWIPVIASSIHLRGGRTSEDIMRVLHGILNDVGCTITRTKTPIGMIGGYMRKKIDVGTSVDYKLNLSATAYKALREIYKLEPEEAFKLVPRYLAEYEPGMVQISSVVRILTPNGKIVLTKLDTGERTYVQGHTNARLDSAFEKPMATFTDVDGVVSESILFSSLIEANIKQEIIEEAMSHNTVNDTEINLKAVGIIRSYHDVLSDGHLGIAYEVILDYNPILYTTEEGHEPDFVLDIDALENKDKWMEAFDLLRRLQGQNIMDYGIEANDQGILEVYSFDVSNYSLRTIQ